MMNLLDNVQVAQNPSENTKQKRRHSRNYPPPHTVNGAPLCRVIRGVYGFIADYILFNTLYFLAYTGMFQAYRNTKILFSVVRM
jgi:hypothetical protein